MGLARKHAASDAEIPTAGWPASEIAPARRLLSSPPKTITATSRVSRSVTRKPFTKQLSIPMPARVAVKIFPPPWTISISWPARASSAICRAILCTFSSFSSSAPATFINSLISIPPFRDIRTSRLGFVLLAPPHLFQGCRCKTQSLTAHFLIPARIRRRKNLYEQHVAARANVLPATLAPSAPSHKIVGKAFRLLPHCASVSTTHTKWKGFHAREAASVW